MRTVNAEIQGFCRQNTAAVVMQLHEKREGEREIERVRERENEEMFTFQANKMQCNIRKDGV